MGRTWQLLAVAMVFGVFGCGPANEPAGGDTVKAAPEAAPAEAAPVDVIPTNE